MFMLNTKGTSLGPGEYIAHKSYSIPHAVAPFGSTVERTGPGGKPSDELDRRAEIVKEIVEETAANSAAITNEVVVMQPSSVFVSQTKRFNGQQVEEKPGPGQYQITSFSEQLEREHAMKARIKAAKEEKRRQVEALKNLNSKRLHVPSIPGKEQKLGYTFVDGAFKVNIKGDELQGARSNSVGPGQYELPPTIDPNKMRGIQWAFTGAKTVSKSKPASAVGPWSYNPNKDIKPLYKYKQSAAFASDTPRTFLPGERRNKGSTQGKWNIDDFEDDDEEFIEQATPGPGYYFRDETTSSFSKAAKGPAPGKYQIFNSGAERFVPQKVNYNNLGPGKYYRDGGLGSKTFNKVLEGGGKFNSVKETLNKEKAKGESDRANPIPGPGYYEIRQTMQAELEKKIERSSYMPFMSSVYRFQNPPGSNENPGPGAYHHAEADGVEVLVEGEEANKANFYFKSGTRRAVFNNRGQRSKKFDLVETPVVGKYNVDQYDIAKRAHQALGSSQMFGSKAPRFQPLQKEIEEEEPENNPIKKIFSNLPTFNAMNAEDELKAKKAQARFNKKGSKPPPPFNSKVG